MSVAVPVPGSVQKYFCDRSVAILVKLASKEKHLYLVTRPNTGIGQKQEKLEEIQAKYSKVGSPFSSSLLVLLQCVRVRVRVCVCACVLFGTNDVFMTGDPHRS